MNYTTALAKLASARSAAAGKPIANNTRLFQRADHIAIRLHNTDIVLLYPSGAITLQSGGWKTVTTKARMNDHIPGRIWSERGNWYLSYGGQDHVYADGITLLPEGTVSGAGALSDIDDARKLRKLIKSYAGAFVDALHAGKVSIPSAGDCWCCLLKDANGQPMGSSDHLLSHIDESYFVPSLLVNALEAMGSSQAEKQTAFAYMHHKPEYAFQTDRAGFVFKGIEKRLYRFMAERSQLV